MADGPAEFLAERSTYVATFRTAWGKYLDMRAQCPGGSDAAALFTEAQYALYAAECAALNAWLVSQEESSGSAYHTQIPTGANIGRPPRWVYCTNGSVSVDTGLAFDSEEEAFMEGVDASVYEAKAIATAMMGGPLLPMPPQRPPPVPLSDLCALDL